MTADEQLESWLHGISLHNAERDECCPDFSCCKPCLLAPEEDRRRFYEAHKAGRSDITDAMLMLFLGAAMKEMGKKAYIAGQNQDL